MANNTFEATFMKLKNGMTLFFKDGGARELIDKLKALVDTKYGPDNPPPSLAGNIWYATCSTAAGTGAKTATSSTGDFVLQTGAMVRLKCTTANTASNPTISIDGSTAKTIQPKSGTSGMAYRWRAQEVIDLVYDGSNFIMSLGPEADTSFYGITKLNSATNSTSTTEAATPSAVKDAYDLAASKVDAAGAAAAAPIQSVNGQTGTVSLGAADVGAVDKTGDTMTGNLLVQKQADTSVYVENTTTGKAHKVALNAGASGRGGIWDSTHAKWLVDYNLSGDLELGASYSTISNSTSGTITIGNSERGVILFIGTGADAGDEIVLYLSNQNGTIFYKRVIGSSGLAMSKTTHTLTIANSSGYNVYTYKFVLQ